MTASVFDEYLPVEARSGHRSGPRVALSAEEFTVAVWAIRDAHKLPKRRGERGRELDALAERYGVHVRTLYRWAEDDTTTVVVNGWHALFRMRRGGAPRQVTGWQRPR